MTTEHLLYCEVSDEDDPNSTHSFDTAIAYFMLLSVPFLIATIFVYRFVPELYNLHGKCLLCYLISLTFAFLFTAFIKCNNSFEQLLCHTSGWIMYFAYLAAFLWLSVICYDLWSNLRYVKVG